MSLAVVTGDAVRAIALAGRDGVAIAALWRIVSPAERDGAMQAFLWQQLCKHPHLTFSDTSGALLRGAVLLAMDDLAKIDAAHVTASAKLRARLCGCDASDGAPALPDDANMLAVIEHVARSGEGGVLQSELTKSVGVAANKLAYSLAKLEAGGVLQRSMVWIMAASKPLFGINAHRAVAAPAADDGGGEHGRQAVRPGVRTNMLTLSALHAPPPPRPLRHFVCHAVPELSLLELLLGELERAPLNLLPLSRCRQALGLLGKASYGVWHKLRLAAEKTGRVAQVEVQPDYVPAGWMGRVHGRKTTQCLRLQRLVACVAGAGGRGTASLDRSPAAQMVQLLKAVGAAGLPQAALASRLQLTAKHAAKRAGAIVDSQGVQKGAAEQQGRTIGYRLFAPGAVPDMAVGSALKAGQGGNAGKGAARAGRGKVGKTPSGRQPARTQQAEARTGWLLEHLRAEKVVAADVVRTFLQFKHAVAEGVAAQRLKSQLDHATARRLLDGLVESGQVAVLEVPHPLDTPTRLRALADRYGAAPSPATATGLSAVAGPSPPSDAAPATQRTLRLLTLPGLPADGPEVIRVTRAIGSCKSWQSYVDQYRHKAVPDGNGRLKSKSAAGLTRVSTMVAQHQQRLEAYGAGPDGADGRLICEAFEFPERDEDGAQSLAMRLGYVPGRALRAQRLHSLLLERAAAGGDRDAGVATAELAAWLAPADYFVLCGLWAPPPEPAVLLGLFRGTGAGPAAMSGLPPASRAFFLEAAARPTAEGGAPSQATHVGSEAERRRTLQQTKASGRLGELLRLLASLGLLGVTPAPDSAGSAAADGKVGARYAVRVTVTSHVEWHGEASGGAGPSEVGRQEAPWREYDLTLAEERAEYWESLKSICANRLPSRGGVAKASRDAFHLPRRCGRQPAAEEEALPAESELSPRTGVVFGLLREAQWSNVRPLTSRQKQRLVKGAPAVLPPTAEALVATADKLEVHPLQLTAYIRSTRNRRPAQPGEPSGGRRGHKRAAALVTEAPLTKQGGGAHFSLLPLQKRIRHGKPTRQPAPAPDANHKDASQTALVRSDRQHTAAWSDAAHEGLLVECVGPCPTGPRNCMPTGGPIGRYAAALRLLCESGAGLPDATPAATAGAGAPFGPKSGAPQSLRVRAEWRAVESLEVVNRHLDWGMVGRALGRQGANCRRIISRIILCRPASTDARNLPRLASAIAGALRAASFDLLRASAAKGTVGARVAHLAHAVGIEASTDAITARAPAAPPLLTPRQWALAHRLLCVMEVREQDYCAALGAELLSPFAPTEVVDALLLLLRHGWVTKNKGTPPMSRRYRHSAAYTEQLALAFQAPVCDAAARFSRHAAASKPQPATATPAVAVTIERPSTDVKIKPDPTEGPAKGPAEGPAERPAEVPAEGPVPTEAGTGSALERVRLRIPPSILPGGVMHALELAARGQLELHSQLAASSCAAFSAAAVASIPAPVPGAKPGLDAAVGPAGSATRGDGVGRFSERLHLLEATMGGAAGDGPRAMGANRGHAHSRADELTPEVQLLSVHGDGVGRAAPATLPAPRRAIEDLADSVGLRCPLYRRLSPADAAVALSEVGHACDCKPGGSGGGAAELEAEVAAAGVEGRPLLELLHWGEEAGGLARAAAALRTLCAMQDRSLVVGVSVADERRYVSWRYLGFWPARTCRMLAEGDDGYESADEAAPEQAATPAAGAASPAAGKADAAGGSAATGGRERERVTHSGLKPRFGEASTFFIPGVARRFDGTGSDHYERLRAALLSRVVANPGIAHKALVSLFSAFPACHVRAVLHALVAAAELVASHAAVAPRATLFGEAGPASDNGGVPASRRHYFISPVSAMGWGDIVTVASSGLPGGLGAHPELTDWQEGAGGVAGGDRRRRRAELDGEADGAQTEAGGSEEESTPTPINDGRCGAAKRQRASGGPALRQTGPRLVPPGARHLYQLCRCNAACTRPGPFTVFAVKKPPLGTKRRPHAHQAGLYHGLGGFLTCDCNWDQLGSCCPHGDVFRRTEHP